MEIVSSIGGLFFRTRDPESLGKWYLDRLGINLVPGDYDTLPWQQEAGPCAFAPFPEDSKYFGPDKRWMVNFSGAQPRCHGGAASRSRNYR
jgi:hypothetical protein